MKQSKRLLSVLLAMLMVFSVFTVGASAIKTSYAEPAGYDSVLKPYFTNDQAATALLDMLDDILAKVNMNEDYVVVEIHIYSLDSTLDTVVDILDHGITSVIKGLAGDVADLKTSYITDTSTSRRRSGSVTDFTVFLNLCRWASVNSGVLQKFLDGSIDLGVINNFFNITKEVPMLKNLHGFLCDMIYKLLINNGEETGYEVGAADSYNLDNILQDFLNNRVLTFVLNLLDEETVATVVDFLGIKIEQDEEGKITNQMGLLYLLPSLKASDISITTTSTYDFVINIFNALIDDIVVPFGGKLILDLLKVGYDDVDAEESAYIDIAIGLFVDAQVLKEAGVIDEDVPDDQVNVTEEFLRWKGVENPEKPKPIDKINVSLEYILKVGLKRFIHFVGTPGRDSHLELTPYFSGMFSDLIRMVIPMLPSLASDFTPLTAEQEAAVETMEDEELFAFLARMILEAFVDGVYFPDDCKSIKSLATYTLVNVAEELLHSEDADFQAMIDSGAINPDSDQCLDIAAAVINYYLVGGTTFESTNLTPTFNELVNDCFDTFLGKYAALFSMYPTEADKRTYQNNPWFKLYNSVNQWIPLTNIIYGVEDSWYGMKNLLMDSIIGNVLDFDINGLLGIIGRRPDSELNKPLSQLIANLLARVINGVFKLPNEKANQKTNSFQVNNLIIPYDYTTLDQIVKVKNSTSDTLNGTGLKNTGRELLEDLPNICQSGAVAAESLDIIAELIGVIKLKNFDFMQVQYGKDFPAGQSYSINELKALYNEVKVPDNEGIYYYEDDYTFFHMVDFEAWTYLDFKKALREAAQLIEDFDNNKNPARADITYAYYLLQKLHDDYLMANQPAANDYYLTKFMNQHPRIANNDDGHGDIKYTNRSWDAYVKAYNFAQKVEAEYTRYKNEMRLGDYPQSKVNTARSELRDAIRGLKLNAGLGDADYSELLNAINNLLFLGSPSTFTAKSVQDVVDAYNEALAFSREVWYDADGQIIVDGVTERLNKAYDLLVNIPLLEFFDDSMGIVTDESNSYIYGLPQDMFNEDAQLDCDNDFTIYLDWYLWGAPTQNCTAVDLVSTSGGNGTGSRIKLLSDDDGDGVMKTEREYTVVYFGDVTGDSHQNGMDAVVLRAYAARMLQVNHKTEYINIAGDADSDNILSVDDAKLLDKCGVMKATIDQDASARVGDPVAFIDIVNK